MGKIGEALQIKLKGNTELTFIIIYKGSVTHRR
nr:MAG TPA: hypothetical protein [Crassvirales sp.]